MNEESGNGVSVKGRKRRAGWSDEYIRILRFYADEAGAPDPAGGASESERGSIVRSPLYHELEDAGLIFVEWLPNFPVPLSRRITYRGRLELERLERERRERRWCWRAASGMKMLAVYILGSVSGKLPDWISSLWNQLFSST